LAEERAACFARVGYSAWIPCKDGQVEYSELIVTADEEEEKKQKDAGTRKWIEYLVRLSSARKACLT
jgi:hypothetical protein